MSDRFNPIPLQRLLALALSDFRENHFMGIPGSLFFRPQFKDPFRMMRYGQLLETPIGVAAGPHTQLAGNIIAAWLCGARYIELKTIQTLDELDVPKPCIDAQDEGYNCEWSQELRIQESYTEYLNAWIIIHILRKELGFSGPSGTLFNMSVGYNLNGIRNENVQWFMNHMRDCKSELAAARESVRIIYPEIDQIDIPSCISDHITLSTMHGCPPEEIEQIGIYLIEEKKLHTTIKLNPTLLGAGELHGMLNDRLGFTAVIPDLAFEHDLKYPDALRILKSLQTVAAENGVQFGVKLTNTLESINNKDVFDSSETMMYMSGRALHPVSISLARKLQNDNEGRLDVSFSAGVDCFNIHDVIVCGMKPVTVCTDLLKPGGYGRLYQYIENLRSEYTRIPDDVNVALANLNAYADRVAGNPAYHKGFLTSPSIKTSRELGWFDCIHAPCTDTCPTNQDVPEYMHHTALGDTSAAFETIFRTNPFPSVTGMVCDHLCQFKCTRINYDEALQIREIKRFVAESGFTWTPPPAKAERTSPPAPPLGGEGRRAAIIGAGPAGLSCGWFLRNAGFNVDIFEQKKLPGGMVSAAIPSFRLTSQAIETDIQRILASGVQLHDNHPVDHTRFEELRRDYDVLFLAAGAQKSLGLKIIGIEAPGVVDPLEFLFDVRQNQKTRLGSHVVIIGGGNTAMDAARTAYRLVGNEGTVTIVYRRTVKEMPADHGEIEAVKNEGIAIIELANPLRVQYDGEKVTGIVCSRNMLSEKGKDGRPSPVAIPGSEFEISCDTIIPAIGQQLSLDFLDPEQLITKPGSYKTRIPRLYIGGDALRGASTAINAIGDGRKAASEILADMEHLLPTPAALMPSPPTPVALMPSPPAPPPEGEGGSSKRLNFNISDLLHRKATRDYGSHPNETAIDQRRNFDLVISSLSPEQARKEASRCLQCDVICNVCVSVCPNLANFGYQIEPVRYSLKKAVLLEDGSIAFRPDKIFKVDQQLQILNIRDLCNECGNCTTFCPSSGRPFADKPGICLSVKSLSEEGSGFFLSRLPEKLVLIHKENENIRTLSLIDGKYVYETNQVKAVIDPAEFTLVDVKFLIPCVKEFHFEFAAEMSIVMKGAIQVSLFER